MILLTLSIHLVCVFEGLKVNNNNALNEVKCLLL